MIAKSDLIILVLSASALAVGVYRWQLNTQAAGIAALPAPASVASSTHRPATTVLGSTDNTNGTAASGFNQPDVIEVQASAVGEPIVVEDTGPIDEAPQSLYGTYRVRSGDYLGLIAQRFGTDVATLRELNGINGSIIQVGQQIRYPQVAN